MSAWMCTRPTSSDAKNIDSRDRERADQIENAQHSKSPGTVDDHQNQSATVEGQLSQPSASKARSRLRTAAVLLTAVTVGVVAGVFIPPDGIRSAVERWLVSGSPQVAEDAASDSGTEDAAHSGVFEVSIAAQKTYGLLVGKANVSSFTQHVDVPAFIRERPP